jgi:hypothetical protein
VPAWANDEWRVYETDEDYELAEDDEYDDAGLVNVELEDEEFSGLIDDAEFNSAYDYFKSDFVLNSAEMNTVQPEDLDEVGESSNQVSRIIFYYYFI